LFDQLQEIVEIPPPEHKLVSASVFNNEPALVAATSAMYFWLTSQNDFPNLNLNPDMLSDELMNYSSDPNLIQFAQKTT